MSVYIMWEITPLRASGEAWEGLVGQFTIVWERYETVAAWLGEYHQVMADVVDCWQVLELTSNLHNAHV